MQHLSRFTLVALLTALIAVFAMPVFAADLSEVVKLNAGVNGAWFNGEQTSFPSDFEAGGVGAASLSPHISLVGAAWYGFSHEYIRYAFGPRITVTDVNNEFFSIGVGIEWNGSSRDELQPNEWYPTASVGWVPLPEKLRALTLVAQGGYGIESDKSRVTLGIRYGIALN